MSNSIAIAIAPPTIAVGISRQGAPGREIELQATATYIQWRYVGYPTWTDLLPLSDLGGFPAGGTLGQLLAKASGADYDTAWVDPAEGGGGGAGDNGWSPILAVVSDSARRVLQLTDWAGGEGTKPATGSYLGATGLVATAAEAVDIRGAPGAAGSDGTNGSNGAAGADGKTWYSGSGAPSDATGVNGDWYLRTDTSAYYGPKAAGTWSGTGPNSLIGATGAAGSNGTNGTNGTNGSNGTNGENAVTFADATARGAATPGFVGQLGLQLDTVVLYRGTATSAGSWTAAAAAMVGAEPAQTAASQAEMETGTEAGLRAMSPLRVAQAIAHDAVPKSAYTQDSGILVGTGAGTYQEETGATARASLGVGAIGTLATVKRCLTFDFDGGGAALTTATKAILPYLPAAFTPIRWSVQCSVNARTGAAGNASVAMTVTVGNFSTSAFPAGATGGTQPSVTTAAGATAAADFTDTEWAAGQAVMVELTGTPTALWATLIIEGTSVI